MTGPQEGSPPSLGPDRTSLSLPARTSKDKARSENHQTELETAQQQHPPVVGLVPAWPTGGSHAALMDNSGQHVRGGGAGRKETGRLRGRLWRTQVQKGASCLLSCGRKRIRVFCTEGDTHSGDKCLSGTARHWLPGEQIHPGHGSLPHLRLPEAGC